MERKTLSEAAKDAEERDGRSSGEHVGDCRKSVEEQIGISKDDNSLFIGISSIWIE